MDKRV